MNGLRRTNSGYTLGRTATTKIGFHGATPSDQAANIADPADGTTVDAEARAAIGSILDLLEEKGLMAAAS